MPGDPTLGANSLDTPPLSPDHAVSEGLRAASEALQVASRVTEAVDQAEALKRDVRELVTAASVAASAPRMSRLGAALSGDLPPAEVALETLAVAEQKIEELEHLAHEAVPAYQAMMDHSLVLSETLGAMEFYTSVGVVADIPEVAQPLESAMGRLRVLRQEIGSLTASLREGRWEAYAGQWRGRIREVCVQVLSQGPPRLADTAPVRQLAAAGVVEAPGETPIV